MKKYLLLFMVILFTNFYGNALNNNEAIPGIRFSSITVSVICNDSGGYTYTFDMRLCEIYTPNTNIGVFLAPNQTSNWISGGIATQVGNDDFHYISTIDTSSALATGTWVMQGYYNPADGPSPWEADGTSEYCSSWRSFEIPLAPDCGCTPEDITITANGTDITETLTYTIPCGENCVTIHASNITDAQYNTSDPVLTNLQGLFCVPQNSTLQSFTAVIKGTDSCGDDYYQTVLVKIEQDCCPEKPYIEPYWDFCDSNNVCELDNWPVHVLGTDGTPLLLIDGYTFLWSDGSTSNALYGVVASQNIWVEVTYPNGCVYKIYYQEDCCNDVITVEFDECPSAQMLPQLERQLRSYNERTSVVSREDLVSAIDSYRVSEGATREASRVPGAIVKAKECDPCVGGIVNIRVLVNGSVITNFDSITITDNSTGTTTNVNTSNWIGVYVDTSYTITVVSTDSFGHTCTYTYTFIYDCTPDCDVTAPINLHIGGIIGTTLFWDPVPGAVGYIVSSPSTAKWCHCKNQVSIVPIETNQALLALPQSLVNKCFAWQVTAICADGTLSPTSTSLCYSGGGIDVVVKEALKKVSITPNPTKGEMTFNIDTNIDTEVTILVHDTYGTLIKTFVKRVNSDKTNSFSWDGSRLRKGIYFVNFTTKEETIHKQVIVK